MSIGEWILAFLAALGVGIGKAGLSGMGLFHVLIFAFLFGARASTGVVLPLLLVGDVTAVRSFHAHARWTYVRRMLPPACLGVVLAAWRMRELDETLYRPLIGWITLILSILQFARMYRPDWFGNVPHARWFAWTMGILAGAATMLANAAGPVFAVYLVAVGLPKMEFVGTSAWFFFIINLFKVPFSVALGLIRGPTLMLNVILAPAVLAGVLAGRWLLERIPQRVFEHLLLAFAVLSAIKLMGAF
ncbi:MAG TPA: sulfite exporter TauE/SafE family protein [Vicinamibacterales bacterium]|nr:sulfite exporter TauE/SafE family protein [Vicinamibacterales bacterium]